MIKRLSISIVLLSLAILALGAAAFAFFSDSGRADVTIQAGDTNITFDLDRDCNGYEVTNEDGPFPFSWSGIVPGESTTDCIKVHNVGDGDLELYVSHQAFTGNADFRAALRFTYLDSAGTSVICPARVPDHANYTTANSGRGCDLGSLAENAELVFRVKVDFVDDGTDQNALQSRNFGMDAFVTGYTG